MKTNLFSRFRNLFRKPEPDYGESYETYEDYSEEAVEEADESAAASRTGRMLRMNEGARGARSADRNPNGVYVPLAPILAGLLLELQQRVTVEHVGDFSVLLDLDKILPQLSKGVVTVPFGDLREAAPQVFSQESDLDERLVELPLSAVLPQINPDMLARKKGRQQQDIPDDIVSPFADKGRGLSISGLSQESAPSTPPQPVAQPVPAPAPAEPQKPAPIPVSTPAPLASDTRVTYQSAPVQTPRPPAAPLAPPVAEPIQMSAPVAPQAPAPVPVSPSVPAPSPPPAVHQSLPAETPSPAPVTPPQPAPVSAQPATIPLSVNTVAFQHSNEPQSVPITPVASSNGAANGLPTPAAPVGEQALPAQPAPTDLRVIEVALGALAAGWPDAIKQEVIELQLTNARVKLPYATVESGLKRGRLSFVWKLVLSWIQPAVQTGTSANADTEVELPLRVVAPLFIAQQTEAAKSKVKVAVDKDIPNLFSGLPTPDTTGVAVDHSVSKPLDTNYYVWDDQNDVVSEAASNPAHTNTAATEFVTRCATPNEVVSRASALDGVEGALIALPDGLMVASQLPDGVNGDTLAAFLPHLFGKVTQCTQELRMGELNNLKFTVGNVPWKIFRVNALYFAVFGKEGEQMPTAELAALAGELDHKVKV